MKVAVALVVIQKARIENGLTQEELGVKVGNLILIFQKLRTISKKFDCPRFKGLLNLVFFAQKRDCLFGQPLLLVSKTCFN